MEANPKFPTILKANAKKGITAPISTVTQSSLGLYPALRLPKYRAALAKARTTAGAVVTINFVGDSTQLGVGSAAVGGDLSVGSLPTAVQKMFNNNGYTAFRNFFGQNNATYQSNQNDRRVVVGSWGTGNNSMGGPYLTAFGNSLGPMTYTPEQPVDTFIIYQTGSGGTYSTSVNGGTPVTRTVTGATIQKITINCTIGINTLTCTWLSSSPGIVGFVAYNSAAQGIVNIVNSGWGGSTSTDWAATTQFYSPGNSFQYMGADLTVIKLGTNDEAINNIPLFIANMTSIVAAARTTGDVVLMTTNPHQTTSLAIQNAYQAAIMSLGTTLNVPVVDIYGRWVSWAFSQPLGYYGPGPDAVHGSTPGYSDGGQDVFNLIGNP